MKEFKTTSTFTRNLTIIHLSGYSYVMFIGLLDFTNNCETTVAVNYIFMALLLL